MPEGRILREMQDRELTQKCAESKTMQALLATRIEKEELQIEMLEQQKKQEAERHKQKMEHEEEWHSRRLHRVNTKTYHAFVVSACLLLMPPPDLCNPAFLCRCPP